MKKLVKTFIWSLFLLVWHFEVFGQFTFTTNNDAITLASYTGAGGNVVIPDATNGYPVTAIGTNAFQNTAVTSVIIPDSITNIGVFAFYHCYNLTNATIGNNVTSIGDYAFYDCERLNSIIIPHSVTNIGLEVFAHGYSLTNIAVNAANPAYASAGGVLFNKTMTTLIECPAGMTSYSIPGSVTSIGDYAFLYCSHLTNVVIPNGVARIGSQAFCGCSSLTSVTIPGSVTSFGAIIFVSCPNLRQAYFSGNSPDVDPPGNEILSTVFYLDYSVTVYYLPGTTGWEANFGGAPTAPWYLPQPVILENGSGPSAQDNQFKFIISWATNTSVMVECSTNLFDWTVMTTNPLVNGTNVFGDSDFANYSKRFYRVRSQ